MVSIENPARSWLWPLLAMLVKETGRADFIQWYFSLVSTMFDACMHGSTRDKSTTILGSPGVFESLGIRCDKSHSHQAWSATKQYTRDVSLILRQKLNIQLSLADASQHA